MTNRTNHAFDHQDLEWTAEKFMKQALDVPGFAALWNGFDAGTRSAIRAQWREAAREVLDRYCGGFCSACGVGLVR